MAKFHEKSFQRPQAIALATRLLVNRGYYNRTRQRIAFLVLRHHAASGSCAMPSRSTLTGSRLGRTALVQSQCASSSPARSAAGIGRTRHKGHERRRDQDAFHLPGIARLGLHQHSHTLQLKPIIRAGPPASGIRGILRTIPKTGREKGYNLKNAILLTETDQWRFALRCDQCPYQVAVSSFDHQW